MKIFIRAASAISPQASFHKTGLDDVVAYSGNRLKTIEPDYAHLLDAKALRRMSRIVKMGSAAALACLEEAGIGLPDAIITGTAYGCVEDTTLFLKDMVDRDEEALTPTAFINSTHNTVGAQIALSLKCHSYNNTFVHGGISFESALLDALLMLQEKEANHILAGSIDELTDEQFAILARFGLYKNEAVGSADLFNNPSRGAIAGEGAAFFLLSNETTPGTYACIEGAATFYKPGNIGESIDEITAFLAGNFLKPGHIDLVIFGKNGNPADDHIYDAVQESLFGKNDCINYKHLCGEYPTSSSFALWLGATIIKSGSVPSALGIDPVKKIKRILIYNHYQNTHHSLQLLCVA